jgi:aerobic-type carbon monoxide dehydrogenase small subunit (CoxS/CutS family)
MKIRFIINGKKKELDVNPRKTLLRVIREDLGLTGTKYGCGEGECGACTIMFNNKTVNACLVLAGQADGAEIITIEGVGKADKLTKVQKAFVELGAIQCGYCTPGLVLSAEYLLSKNPHPPRQEIKRGLAGNLCRCTGYQKVINAVEKASKE